MHARSSSWTRAKSQPGAFCTTSVTSERGARQRIDVLRQYIGAKFEGGLRTSKHHTEVSKIEQEILHLNQRWYLWLPVARQARIHSRLYQETVPVPEVLAIFSIGERRGIPV